MSLYFQIGSTSAGLVVSREIEERIRRARSLEMARDAAGRPASRRGGGVGQLLRSAAGLLPVRRSSAAGWPGAAHPLRVTSFGLRSRG